MKECTGKKYCDCAREAMKGGANRDVVDGYNDNCPYPYKKYESYCVCTDKCLKIVNAKCRNLKPESVPYPKGEQDNSEDYWADFSTVDKSGKRVIVEANFKAAIRKCESMRSELLKEIISQTPQSVHDKVAQYGFAVNLLKEYTDYLLKNGYCDTDVYSESPTAIDDFMSGKSSEFFTSPKAPTKH